MSTNIRVDEAPPVSSQETQDLTSEDNLSAQVVADTFVQQYYAIIKHCPENTYKFYKDESTLSRPDANGSMRLVKSMKEIDEEIMGSDIKNWDTHLLVVHAQETIEGSIIVGVVGYLRKDNLLKFFSQTFLLALQTRGFYVHNDFFQFIDTSSLIIPNDTAYHMLVMQDMCTSTDAMNQISDSSSYTQNPLLPAADEPNKISVVPQSVSETTENATKVSYASIVTKGSSLPSRDANVQVFSNKDTRSCAPPVALCINFPPLNNAKDTIKEVAHEVLKKNKDNKYISTEEVTDSKNNPVEKNLVLNAQEDANKDSFASIVTKSIPLPQSSSICSKPSVVPSDVKTILIRGIPPLATRRTLTHAVKAYGPVKHKNIQIRQHRDGYRDALVEFNEPNSACLAVQAGTIKFYEWECEVELKKAQMEGSDLEGCDAGNAGGDDSSGGSNGNDDGSLNL